MEHFGTKPGYLGPIGLKKPVKIVADREVAVMADWICGANEEDFHITGVNWGRDLPEPDAVADLRNVVEGDPSPDGKGALAIERGIEVGHVFYLGTKYSAAMNATFLDEAGKPQLMEMGCYGIGITRLPAAAIEQNHDERGIIWPDAIAPFTVVICPIGMDRSAEVKAAADKLHDELQAAGVDVMLDDRGERPGRHVRRLGADRRAASRGDLGPRPQGRPAGIPASTRRAGDQGRGGRCAGFPQGPARRVISRRDCLTTIPVGLGLAWTWRARASRRPDRRAAGRLGAHRAELRDRQLGAADPRIPRHARRGWPTCAGSAP